MDGNNTMLTIGYIAFFVLIFYFLIIRPQNKQKKQRNDMMSKLAVGDEIYTIGGILGLVTRIKEKTIWLKVCDKVEIEILKSAIAGIKTPDIE